MIGEKEIDMSQLDRTLMKRTREILWEWCLYAEDTGYIEQSSSQTTREYGVPLKIGATSRYVQWYKCNRDKVDLL